MADNDFNLNVKTDNLDLIDMITKKTAQLSAALGVIHGCGYDAFNDSNDTIKQNYLWMCADLARDVEDLTLEMTK